MIPLKYTPEQIKRIAKYIWICPPEFTPALNYVNNVVNETFDQTVWIFSKITESGYVNGRYYAYVNNKYQYGYISGSISLIDGTWKFEFSSATNGGIQKGNGVYFGDNLNNYFSAQINELTQLSTPNGKYVFTGFSHNAAAIPICKSDPYYNNLPFSTEDPLITISVPSFIKLCKQA